VGPPRSASTAALAGRWDLRQPPSCCWGSAPAHVTPAQHRGNAPARPPNPRYVQSALVGAEQRRPTPPPGAFRSTGREFNPLLPRVVAW